MYSPVYSTILAFWVKILIFKQLKLWASETSSCYSFIHLGIDFLNANCVASVVLGIEEVSPQLMSKCMCVYILGFFKQYVFKISVNWLVLYDFESAQEGKWLHQILEDIKNMFYWPEVRIPRLSEWFYCDTCCGQIKCLDPSESSSLGILFFFTEKGCGMGLRSLKRCYFKYFIIQSTNPTIKSDWQSMQTCKKILFWIVINREKETRNKNAFNEAILHNCKISMH